jgi:hypothetical protein
MKRSGQVALVLMGVTGATAAGAYMLPSRPQCQAPQPAPVRDITDLGKPAVQQGVAAPGAQPAVQQQPCNRSSSSGSRGWHWYSHSNSYNRTTSSSRPSNSTSVGFFSGNSGSGTSSSSSSSFSSSTSSTARGGFGSTGHAMSGHSGGHAGS